MNWSLVSHQRHSKSHTMIGKIVFLGLILTASSYGEKNQSKVLGGIDALIGEFPSSVAIYTPVQALCGGVVLNENHILTSAKCLHGDNRQVINPQFLRVVAGDLKIHIPSYGRVTATISHIFIHPNYTPTTNDIAVLRTSASFPFPHNTIDSAIRNNRVLPILTSCYFAGWGASSDAGPIDTEKKKLSTPIQDSNACNAPTVHNGQVLDGMICAGSLTPTPASGLCTGNLGGGLYCNNELTGILSFGLGCGAADKPGAGVFTNIRFYRDWIDSVFTSDSATVPGTVV